jgi:hypothetical protein
VDSDGLTSSIKLPPLHNVRLEEDDYVARLEPQKYSLLLIQLGVI